MTYHARKRSPEEMAEPEALGRYRRKDMVRIPLRILFGLLLFSLPAGGPQRLYATLPGKVFALVFVVQIVMERLIQAPDVGGRKMDQGSFVVGWLGHAATFLATVADYFHLQPDYSPFTWSKAWLAAGVVMIVAGQTIRVIAIRTLGRFFTPTVRIQPGHQVVKHGLYRYVRHPSYTGLLLLNLGYVTMFASVLGYAAFVLFNIPAIMNRIQVEEKALIKELGDEYRVYRRQVKRLVPFLY